MTGMSLDFQFSCFYLFLIITIDGLGKFKSKCTLFENFEIIFEEVGDFQISLAKYGRNVHMLEFFFFSNFKARKMQFLLSYKG